MMGLVLQLCRTHFYKIIILATFSVMLLQYGLSVVFYGTKPYLSVSASAFFYGSPKDGSGGGFRPAVSGACSKLSPAAAEDNYTATNAQNLTLGGVYASPSGSGTAPSGNGTSLSNESLTLPLCPSVPPHLVGPLKVWPEAPSWTDLAKQFSHLEPGGRYRPGECVARHHVAIIIPYRDRELHLKLFLYHMHPILRRQQLDYGIFVVEEAGKTKFNRAMLMNIGFVESLKLCDWQCFIFHDVDLLPEDDRNIYSCPEQPRHMSVAVDTMDYKLPYADIFGGVSALTKEQMETVNGFSNEFWGWGGEDDDMSNRVRYHGYKISRYQSSIARYKMMKHTKDKPNPDRYNKLYKGKLRFKVDGLNSLKYKVTDVVLKPLYTWILVELEQPK